MARSKPVSLPTGRRPLRALRWDRGPWILDGLQETPSGALMSSDPASYDAQFLPNASSEVDSFRWFRRNDTFPSNRALFRTENVTTGSNGVVYLELTPLVHVARSVAGGAIAHTQKVLFGHFAAELRAASGSSVVTGFFLHRNGPRQEIDIEILGRRPREMLVNVFYNPGDPGTGLETGYFGTPTRIPLTFDATEDFHLYEIRWTPEAITWWVDGNIVHTRSEWAPTPIPDQPMEVNLNVWSSESSRFAGAFDPSVLPVRASLRSVAVRPDADLLSAKCGELS